MEVRSNAGLFMATAGESFGDGVYELEATQIDGPLNNGYGMLFRVDESSDSFYAFEVSGDGFIWIGWCRALPGRNRRFGGGRLVSFGGR